MDLDKIFSYKEEIENNLTFEETCKLFREILYKPISYYSSDNKGLIYDGTYSETQIEQATRLQQKLSGYIDLYNQIVTKHNEFDEGYLRDKGV